MHRLRTAADILADFDIPLAANQVQHSLLHRNPDFDGVLDACRQVEVALLAYRPLGGGGMSHCSRRGSDRSGLADTLREVATAHGATRAQVARTRLLKRDEHVVAIPGATGPEHVRENAGALSLELSEEEFAAIDRASAPPPSK
jgi:aryl-alcohol dehydrogenase-like predicted oxidoreductase